MPSGPLPATLPCRRPLHWSRRPRSSSRSSARRGCVASSKSSAACRCLAQGTAGAIERLLRARSSAPLRRPLVVGTALIFLADQYVDRGDWDAAMECEAEARRLGNNSADAACLAECERVRTRILLGQGHLDEARGAIVAAVRRSQGAIDFADNCCSSIRYFGDYARRSGVLRPAAEAFAFVVAHPATTPFARRPGGGRPRVIGRTTRRSRD